jgi:preprotein translocase subunit SecG
MSDVLIGLVIVFAFFVIWLLYGLFNSRQEDLEQELDEFSGIYDARREAKNDLDDPDYVKRLHDKFND